MFGIGREQQESTGIQRKSHLNANIGTMEKLPVFEVKSVAICQTMCSSLFNK